MTIHIQKQLVVSDSSQPKICTVLKPFLLTKQGMTSPRWQRRRTGYSWSPVQTLPLLL